MGKGSRLKKLKTQELPSNIQIDSETLKKISVTSQSISFEGPVPPPVLLREYAEISPDYPGRIITMSEKEQDSRISQTDKIIDGLMQNRSSSMRYAFIIILCTILLAGFLFYLNKDWYAITIIITEIIGAVYLYFGKTKKSTEIERNIKKKETS